MSSPRKYLTSYVVIGSILLFSLKDCLGLIHTVLHALPNPYHHHAYLLHAHRQGTPGHDERIPHTHPGQTPHSPPHDLMDHLAHGNQQAPSSQNDKAEIKTIAELTWTIQELFSLHLVKPLPGQVTRTFFAMARIPHSSNHPLTPPPEFP